MLEFGVIFFISNKGKSGFALSRNLYVGFGGLNCFFDPKNEHYPIDESLLYRPEINEEITFTYIHKFSFILVPRRVLKDEYQGPLELDETDYDPNNEGYEEFDNYDTENEHIRESAASPPVSNQDSKVPKQDNTTKTTDKGTTSEDNSRALSFGKCWAYF